ncbi:protein of unknown function [Amycolatopsis arida]|uniref:DUF4333 domain-containing protein n=1 Tax=Amycolatopsis arida TaxID=587909 RepID=A0A1I5X2X9_9PSEU|nr:DUF4333 domain-containing protein [Amycolatopsis arida]TDX92573.1 uncharacterized protein DUF4333 [Amycolatopsis arida]SFQ26176.1 protein of unknown function [Amycolatopsis arida]
MTQPPHPQQGGPWPPQGPGHPGTPYPQQHPQRHPQGYPQQAPYPAHPGYGQQPGPAHPGPGGPAHQDQRFGGGFGERYGGLGAFDEDDRSRRPRSRKPWLIGGAAVLVLGAGAAAAWLLGAFRGDVLDQDSVQDGVLMVLRDSYGEHDVRDARCPADQPARNGVTFDCRVVVAGQARTVRIRVLNDKPQFEVGAPR